MNHLTISRFLIIILLFPLFYGCSTQISDQIKEKISNNETEQAFINTEYAVFVFNVDTEDTWEWYRNSTNVGQLEYGWWAAFEAADKNYTCGFRLFKHPFARPANGNFKKLLDAGQIDLSVGQNTSRKKIDEEHVAIGMAFKRIPNAKVRVIENKNNLIFLLYDKSIVQDLYTTRPDSMNFFSQTQIGQPEQLTVPISYDVE